MKFKTPFFTGLTALVLASQAFAATPTNGSAKSVKKASDIKKSSILDNMSSSFSTVLFGPSLSAPTSRWMPDVENKEAVGSNILTKNYLSLSYKVTPDTTIRPVAYFLFHPVKDDRMSTNAKTGEVTPRSRFEWRDPYLVIQQANLVKSNGLGLTAQVRGHAGVSQSSRNINRVAGAELRLIPSYTLPNSRFSISAVGLAKQNIYSGEMNGGPAMEAYIGPSLDYQISPTLTANLLFEAGASTPRGKSLKLSNFTSDGTDLEPGLSWDITKNINFNPFLDIKTGGKMNAETTSINAALNIKFF